MDSKSLVLAMASIETVISVFQNERSLPLESSQSGELSVDEQDRFAALVNECWIELGPSGRYLKNLVHSYVSKLERAGHIAESDGLMELVVRASVKKDGIPTPNDSCYLSFRLPPTDLSRDLLRIRIYPFHNDVALRLWEAGAVLAEYFVKNPEIVQEKNVVELGAGVGLTGLTIAGICGARDVHMTDYTEECRVNMAHNIDINQKWLHDSPRGKPNVTHGYLDWSSFMISGKDDPKAENVFFDTDILIAADVVYDVHSLKDLVIVVQSFLIMAPELRKAIFGITRRNQHTFDSFIELLKEVGIDYEWIWKGEESQPLQELFPCNFVQKQTDVRIASLTLAHQ